MEAALETLKEEGFAGASARAISRRGDFNQALIFYHFGSLTDLLLAALDETSARRMEAYEAAMQEATSIEGLVQVALDIYREDLASGHITVLSEMITGSLSHRELGPQIVTRMEPWIDFAQRAIDRVLEGSPFATVLPSRDLAFAVVAFYLGIDLLTHLERERPEPERLFAAAARLSPLVRALGPQAD